MRWGKASIPGPLGPILRPCSKGEVPFGFSSEKESGQEMKRLNMKVLIILELRFLILISNNYSR